MAQSELNLVDIRSFGIEGINFYWANRERYNISLEELEAAGVIDDGVYLDASLVEPLKKVNEILKPQGYKIFVKDAYRSPELYRLAFDKRSQMEGGNTFLLNMERMPHSWGKVVDVTLADLVTGQELKMRDNKLDPDGGYKFGYYADKKDPESLEYHILQKIMMDAMFAAGFTLGLKEEFWHFELL